ncbi:MAG: hypothetical protein HFG51_00650 [Lachnospiraceae bacterium]|nr:hypothetical protein [Lachnospiraceae bacterium]
MDDMKVLNREMKKQQLRRQIVPNPADVHIKNLPPHEEESRSGFWAGFFRHKIIFLILLLFLIGAAGSLFYWQRYHQYTEYAVSWEEDLLSGDNDITAESSFVGYIDFGANVVKYTKDGATYIDARGKKVWTQPYEMKSPAAVVNGEYIAIADQQGNTIVICDRNGHQGTATTLLPITKASISAKGVVVAILEDSKSNYLFWFHKDGTPLDIKIKTRLSGDGYPLDLSVSPSGDQVICSYVYMNNGRMDNRVIFYDFSEIGKNVSAKRLVGGFEEPFTGTLVPRVRFLTDTYSFACSDKGLTFFSSKNLASPELLSQAEIAGEINTLFYSENYVGVIALTGEGENPYRMEVFRQDGSMVMKKEFNFSYQHASVSGDQILLWNENSFQVYNMAGTRRFDGSFEDAIEHIATGRFSNSYILTSPQKMREITLQR